MNKVLDSEIGSNMLFDEIKNINKKYLSWCVAALIFLIGVWFFISNSVDQVSQANQDIFAYTVKVRDVVEDLDKIFERAEVNVDVMADAISNSYDANKQQDKTYNLKFIEGINGLVKSVLSNSPNVDGSWFQLNADLPFSAEAYNWYEFKENQFIDVKDQFEGTPSMDRKITPEDDPYYFDAIDNQKAVWSVYVDADKKESMVTISSPVYKEGTLVGVVGIDISMENLQQILKDMQSALGESELYLLDRNNKVILSQLLYNSKSPKDNYQYLNLFKGNNEGPVEYSDNFKKKTAIRLILSNDYKIVIAIENKVLFPDASWIFNLIYIAFALLIISLVIMFLKPFVTMKIKFPTKIAKSEPDETTEKEEEI